MFVVGYTVMTARENGKSRLLLAHIAAAYNVPPWLIDPDYQPTLWERLKWRVRLWRDPA